MIIMGNSRRGDALELIYTENTVPHLLSRKAAEMAIRGHQIVDITLHTIF